MKINNEEVQLTRFQKDIVNNILSEIIDIDKIDDFMNEMISDGSDDGVNKKQVELLFNKIIENC